MKLFSRLLIFSMLFIGLMVSCQGVTTSAEKSDTIEKAVPDVGIAFTLENTVNANFDVGDFAFFNVARYFVISDRDTDFKYVNATKKNDIKFKKLLGTPNLTYLYKPYKFKTGIGLSKA